LAGASETVLDALASALQLDEAAGRGRDASTRSRKQSARRAADRIGWRVDEVLPQLRELGIGLVPYSPLGKGFLTGTIRSTDQFDADDFRATSPRFTGENFERNLAIADEVKAVADEAGATPAQIAIAWLLAKGADIAPIPGTRRVVRLEENVAADEVVLTDAQLARLDVLTPAAGGHHTDEQMQMIER
jgi:aryl-alcohol dehydrogenase-like predicted oxidoreductase